MSERKRPSSTELTIIRAYAHACVGLANVDGENSAADVMVVALVAEVEALEKERDAAIARADAAERTLQEWQQDYGPLIRQSRQHITTEDADVPVRAADRDDLTMTFPLPDGGKDGT